MDVIQSWPPVTRVLVVTTVVLSVLIHSQMIDAMRWPFIPQLIFRLPPKIPEIWRLFTCFTITTPGIGLLFDSYFLYTYSSALESGSPRFSEPGSFFVYVVFVNSIILFLGGYMLAGPFLLSALILALAYTWSQENQHSNVSFFVLNFPAKYLPYFMLFMTAISSGYRGTYIQLTGLIAAHLYDFLTRIWPTFGGGTNFIITPPFVKRWFAPEGIRFTQRNYGTRVDPNPQVPPAAGWSGGGRGPGRRLGGD